MYKKLKKEKLFENRINTINTIEKEISSEDIKEHQIKILTQLKDLETKFQSFSTIKNSKKYKIICKKLKILQNYY